MFSDCPSICACVHTCMLTQKHFYWLSVNFSILSNEDLCVFFRSRDIVDISLATFCRLRRITAEFPAQARLTPHNQNSSQDLRRRRSRNDLPGQHELYTQVTANLLPR